MNRAHWTPKENSKKTVLFCIFPAHGKTCLKLPQMVPGGVFPTNPDLANILGDTDFDFENFYFLDCFGSQTSRFPGSRFQDFQIFRFAGSQISKFPEIWLGPALGRAGPGLGRAGRGLVLSFPWGRQSVRHRHLCVSLCAAPIRET